MTSVMCGALAIAVLLPLYLCWIYLLLHPRQFEELMRRFVEWIAMIINQSFERLKKTMNDFNIKRAPTLKSIAQAKLAAYSRHLVENAPGWVSFLLDLYLGDQGIKSQILELELHAPDSREQMRKVAAKLIRVVLAMASSDITIYKTTLTSEDLPAEEEDDLKRRCELFEEIINDLSDRVEAALSKYEREAQDIDRIRRQAAALQAAKSSLERQQAEVNKLEEVFEADFDEVCGVARERAEKGHADAAQKLVDLRMMRRVILRDVSDDLGEKEEADHTEEGTNMT